MSYQFQSHQKLIERSLSRLSWLFVAQLPEGILSLVQKYFESEWAESPKLAFLILYPLFCASAAISSGFTFLVITAPSDQGISWRYLIKEIAPKLKFLVLSSWFLGIVMIPATLALVFPGIWVLSHYLFLPFLIMQSPNDTLSSLFNQSKSLALKNYPLCLFTAFLNFLVSLLSYLGTGILSQQSIPLSFLLSMEVVFGMVISSFLLIWTTTLYLEVSRK